MTDPASTLDGAQTSRIFRLIAVCDLLTGVGLVVAGFLADQLVLKIIGLALLLSGGAVLAYFSWRSNQPIQL